MMMIDAVSFQTSALAFLIAFLAAGVFTHPVQGDLPVRDAL